MKKVLFAAICLIGFQSVSFAQEMAITSSPEETKNEPKVKMFAAFGAGFLGDYEINNKLGSQGLPQMADVLPEFSVGFNLAAQKLSFDLEFIAAYGDEKTSTTRIKTTNAGIKARGHYVPVKTNSFFISGGLDLSYIGTQADLYRRDNVIDLNDLDPATQTGHISLRNELLYAGPSVAVGLFQDKGFPIRLNFGYDWAVTNGKWKSDFGDVTNTVKESGHGRAYAKVTLAL